MFLFVFQYVYVYLYIENRVCNVRSGTSTLADISLQSFLLKPVTVQILK